MLARRADEQVGMKALACQLGDQRNCLTKVPKQHEVVVLPTPPLPPTNIHCNVSEFTSSFR